MEGMMATEKQLTKRQLVERAKEEEPLIENSLSEKPIVRKTAVAYWCPFCDFSMEIRLQKCAKCGAIREGDMVRK